MDENAEYAGVTKKRLQNIISDHKRDHGRLPDWVCDGKGTTKRMVRRGEFENWLGSVKRRRGRPGKRLD